MAEPQHFTIVVLDIESSGGLTGPEKTAVRAELYAIVRAALDAGGIAPAAVHIEDRGDGIFLLVDAAVSKRHLFDPFLGIVDEGLSARPVGAPALRIRMVVHHGDATPDDHGSSGSPLDEAFAMLDAPEVRAALRDSARGRIALVVPDDLYRSVVRGYPVPADHAFRMRRLETKRGRIRAWVTVTGTSEQPGSGPREAEPAAPQPSAPTMTLHNGDYNDVERNYGSVGRGNEVTITPPARDRGDR